MVKYAKCLTEALLSSVSTDLERCIVQLLQSRRLYEVPITTRLQLTVCVWWLLRICCILLCSLRQFHWHVLYRT